MIGTALLNVRFEWIESMSVSERLGKVIALQECNKQILTHAIELKMISNRMIKYIK